MRPVRYGRPLRGAMLALVLAIAGVAGPAAPVPAAEAAARGPVTGLPLPRFVSLRAERANARRGPDLEHRIDWAFVRRGLPLEITAEYGHWRRVRDADGLGGWVHHSLLSGVRTGLVRGSEPVALRGGPQAEAALIALAEPGAVVRIESWAGGWCEIAAGRIDGWIPAASLWGVGPDERID